MSAVARYAQPQDGAVCSVCGRRYPRTEYGSLDLRLTKTKAYPLEFTLAPTPPTEHSFVSVPLEKNPAPQVDLSSLSVPRHLTPEILELFPQGAFTRQPDAGSRVR